MGLFFCSALIFFIQLSIAFVLLFSTLFTLCEIKWNFQNIYTYYLKPIFRKAIFIVQLVARYQCLFVWTMFERKDRARVDHFDWTKVHRPLSDLDSRPYRRVGVLLRTHRCRQYSEYSPV